MNSSQPPDAERAKLYESMSPQASKFLMANGSIIDGSMAVVAPPDPERAAMYASMSPQAAKFLMPDGSITSESGGGFGGGGTVMWFAALGERDAYFAANPDRLRQGISVGVGNPVAAYTYDGTAWLPGALAFKGGDGADGQRGEAGIGIPVGGLPGQALRKKSLADFDTEWRDAAYMHTQTTPSAVWNIQHNLGKKYVNAVAADGSGIRMVGWINDEISTDNLLVIEFSEPLAGTAYIN